MHWGLSNKIVFVFLADLFGLAPAGEGIDWRGARKAAEGKQGKNLRAFVWADSVVCRSSPTFQFELLLQSYQPRASHRSGSW